MFRAVGLTSLVWILLASCRSIEAFSWSYVNPFPVEFEVIKSINSIWGIAVDIALKTHLSFHRPNEYSRSQNSAAFSLFGTYSMLQSHLRNVIEVKLVRFQDFNRIFVLVYLWILVLIEPVNKNIPNFEHMFFSGWIVDRKIRFLIRVDNVQQIDGS